MCTTKYGTIFNKPSRNQQKSKKNKNWILDAMEAFGNDQRLFKRNDYRCLKPSNTKRPEKWSYYDLEGFRAARTEDELNKVKEIKYDKYFFNFEDPWVFKRMLHPKKGPRLWRKVYGFDFAYVQNLNKQPVLNYGCMKYCYKAKRKKFARNCKKKGGFFANKARKVLVTRLLQGLRTTIFDKNENIARVHKSMLFL